MSKSRYDIVKIISETNFSEEYQENMKRFYPDFVLSEDMYKIELYSTIYSNDKLKTVIWSKSTLDQNNNVYTLPEYRRKGYLKQIILAINALLADMSIPPVKLSSSEEGLQLYRGCGFISDTTYASIYLKNQ